MSSVFLLLLILLIILIVSLSGNPLKYRKDRIKDIKYKDLKTIDDANYSILKSVLLEEHKKVNEEIGRRQEIEDRWFQLKFIFVGVLLSFFLLKVFGGNQSEPKLPKERFKELLDNGVIFVSLGVSCLVCICIDFHLANNAKVTKQLGLWISENIEKPFYHSWSNYQDPNSRNLLLWEMVLRNPSDESSKSSSNAGPHSDLLSNLINWPTYMYSLTIILYLSLASCYYYERKVFSAAKRSPPSWEQPIWYFVHVSLFVLIILAHQYPSQLEMKIQIFWTGWLKQVQILLSYFFLGLLLIVVQILYTTVDRVHRT